MIIYNQKLLFLQLEHLPTFNLYEVADFLCYNLFIIIEVNYYENYQEIINYYNMDITYSSRLRYPVKYRF